MSAHAPTVFVVDDDADLRATLQVAFTRAGFQALAYESAEAFVDGFRFERPGCLVLDEQLPGMSGLELQQLLARQGFAIPTVMITGQGSVRTVVRAIQAGAIDVLEKPVPIQALLRRVQGALDQDATRLRCEAERIACAQRLARLSPREREVMVRLASNQSSKRIAAELGISPKTVGVHRARIMAKMETDGIVALTNIAHRLGIVE